MMTKLTRSIGHSASGTRHFSENLFLCGVSFSVKKRESRWTEVIGYISELGFEYVYLTDIDLGGGNFDFDALDQIIDLCNLLNLKVQIQIPHFGMGGTNYENDETEDYPNDMSSIVSTKYRYDMANAITSLAERYGHNTTILGWHINNDGLDRIQVEILRRLVMENQIISISNDFEMQHVNLSTIEPIDLVYIVCNECKFNNLVIDDTCVLNIGRQMLWQVHLSENKIIGVMQQNPGDFKFNLKQMRLNLFHIYAAGGEFACFDDFIKLATGLDMDIPSGTRGTSDQRWKEVGSIIEELNLLRKINLNNAQISDIIQERTTAIIWDQTEKFRHWMNKRYPEFESNQIREYLELMKSLGAPVSILSSMQDIEDYNVILLSKSHLKDQASILKCMDYVEKGGHIIILPVYANLSDFIDVPDHGGMIAKFIGATIIERNVSYDKPSQYLSMKSKEYDWDKIGDIIVPLKGTEVLATYTDPYIGQMAAVTRKSHGKGSVTYFAVNTQDSYFKKNVIGNTFETFGVTIQDYPPGVFVYFRDGFNIALNYSGFDYKMNVPFQSSIHIGEKILKPGEVLVWTD